MIARVYTSSDPDAGGLSLSGSGAGAGGRRHDLSMVYSRTSPTMRSVARKSSSSAASAATRDSDGDREMG